MNFTDSEFNAFEKDLKSEYCHTCRAGKVWC